MDVQKIEIEKGGNIVVFPGEPKSETADRRAGEWDNI